jgi:hypothetical protein
MKACSWLGVGVLAVLLGWDAPKAQAQAAGTSKPLSSMFQTTGAQPSTSLSANYYALMQAQHNAGKNQVAHPQQSRAGQSRAQAPMRVNPRAAFANLPWFATNWFQVRTMSPQPLKKTRR